MDKNDGESETLSPYAPNFWNHIEPGIISLVKAFVSKNYLPYSSCEGHSIFGRRFVALAFPDTVSALKLEEELSQVDVGILKFRIKHISDYYHNEEKHGKRDLLREVGWLNSIYLRGYADYWFLEVSIGDNTPPTLKNLPAIVKKLIYRQCQTEALECLVKHHLQLNPN